MFREKEVRRIGQKQKRLRQKERQDYSQKNKRGDIEKCDETDSTKITDRGKTLEVPGLRSGGEGGDNNIYIYKYLILMKTNNQYR